MISHRKYLSVCVLAIAAVAAVLSNPSLGTAATAPSLGAASSFAVLGGTAVTCTDSVITGDVGAANNVVTITRCVITGTVHPTDPSDVAPINAQTALTSAYNNLVGQTSIRILDATLGTDPGPLPPGVYSFNAPGVAFTDKTLTLDGSTNPNGIWIFQVNAALTGTRFQVIMTNGAQPCNVYWAVGAGVTMTDSLVQGNILAGNPTDGSITITDGSNVVVGRVLAKIAVTMTNASVGACALVDQAKKNCPKDGKNKKKPKCNQGVGNGPEGCDPGKSNKHLGSNDEDGGTPGDPGRKGGGKGGDDDELPQ